MVWPATTTSADRQLAMSAPRYRIPPKFLSLLHERGMHVYNIAAQAGMGISTAQKTLAMHPLTGHQHRAKLAPYLTIPELAALAWTHRGDLLLPVEQLRPCSTPDRPLSVSTNNQT